MSIAPTEKIFPVFLKYVSANVLGMIGYSCYILADTFFIARGIGADALAALNLVLPAYSLMNGTGLMIGMGSAARYTLSAAGSDNKCVVPGYPGGHNFQFCRSAVSLTDSIFPRSRRRYGRICRGLYPHPPCIFPALPGK